MMVECLETSSPCFEKHCFHLSMVALFVLSTCTIYTKHTSNITAAVHANMHTKHTSLAIIAVHANILSKLR